MFGKDHFIISKPQQVKPMAKTFMENIRDVTNNKPKNVATTVIEFQDNFIEHKPLPTLPKPKLKQPNEIAVKSLTRENVDKIKPEVVKPTAKNFLSKVQANYVSDKLLFSYSDTRGKLGVLESNGKNIKVIVKKNSRKDFVEEQIEIYQKNNEAKADGISIQLKGFGNTKELSIANALKKAVAKLNPIQSNISEKVFMNYALSTVSTLPDGGFECKVKVTPGKT